MIVYKETKTHDMHIEINDNTSLREIQKVFSNFYPYLQVAFFKKTHKKNKASADQYLIDPGKKISDIKQTHISGLLEMKPMDKVADVEREFQQRFGLPVQILCKEKDRWVQTTGMDEFTLKELNEMSRSASDEFVVTDYEEGFNENKE